jgi:threonine dehydrogenase-like Zn-dependent dehydrogenase
MNDQDLRALVRDAVARHFAPPAPRTSHAAPGTSHPAPRTPHPAPTHVSQVQYLTVVNTGDACVIEPDVTCNHCGYCKCHGH